MSDDKVVHLSGTRLTPEIVLIRTQQSLPRIKAVAVVILWDDGSCEVDWSRMPLSDMAYASMTLQEQVRRSMFPGA